MNLASTTTTPLSTEAPRSQVLPVAAAAHVFEPTRVRIPAIGVDASLRRLGLTNDGRIRVPSNPDDVGWYRAAGPTVVIGHVDSKTGPAVFFRLRELERGSRIALETEDGTTRFFVIDDVTEAKKSDFPTDRVYRGDAGADAKSSLRLVTCGGSFNRSTHHYESNVIVFAHALLTLSRPL